MTTTVPALLPGWVGSHAYDAEGVRVGHVGDVLFDVFTRAPAWLALVLEGLGEPWVVVPARGLRHHVAGVRLACTREQIHAAPTALAPPGELSRGHATALTAHYRVRCGAGPWHGVADTALTVVRPARISV